MSYLARFMPLKWHQTYTDIITPASHSDQSPDDIRRIILTNQLALTFAITCFLYIVIFYFVGSPILSLAAWPFELIFITCIILNKYTCYTASKYLLIFNINGAITLFSLLVGKDSGIIMAFFAALMVPIILFHSNNRSKRNILCFLIICLFVFVETLGYKIVEPISIENPFFIQMIYLSLALVTFSIILLGMNFYITSATITENLLKKSQEEVHHQKTLAMKLAHQSSYGVLTRGISHEIKNPMSMLRTRCELVLENLDEKLEIEKFADVMIRNIDRLVKLMNNMLEYGNKMAQNKEAILIVPFVEDLIDLAKGSIQKKRITIRTHFFSSPSVYADANDIHQVFINLLANAIQYTSEGGQIEVFIDEKKPFTNIDGISMRGVRIIFQDNGCGISDVHLPQLFDPYFTTKNESHNTGLGLSLAQKAVVENKGTIDVKSSVNDGTAFTIYFPSPNNDDTTVT
ncbi:MAG: hypothetical protein HRT90_00135 [Candidatus Margulisbacteria bacterium]|nr:hypothetical protein [Candidatus Margulisiibacteriota bacterium]